MPESQTGSGPSTFGAGRDVPVTYGDLGTFHLQDSIVYGPIPTRRKGHSLGINLLPTTTKVCSFNCVYCQCDWTPTRRQMVEAPAATEVGEAVDRRFREVRELGIEVDIITFAGNGEPCLHPALAECVDLVTRARDRHLPGTRTSILSNGTELGKPGVIEALARIDQRVMKLDAGTDGMLRSVNIPLVPFDMDDYERNLARLPDVTIQACFIQGKVDNTGSEEVEAWLARLERIRPVAVQIYPIARVPAALGLEIVPTARLEEIGARVADLGIQARVVGSRIDPTASGS